MPLIDVGRWLGVGLAGLINVFDPRIVVLGGLFAQMAPFTLPIVRAPAGRPQRWPSRASRSRSSLASLGRDAPVLGAAERAFEPLLADPAGRLTGFRKGPPVVQTGAAM